VYSLSSKTFRNKIIDLERMLFNWKFFLIDFESMTFLETEQGKPFMSVFRHLRLQYIISDLASARIIEQDSLIPSGKRAW
jgi:hypothetical protein